MGHKMSMAVAYFFALVAIVAVVASAAPTVSGHRTYKDPATGQVTTLPWPYNNTLVPGDKLMPNDVLYSSTSYLTLQHDGNLVLYRKEPKTSAIWASNTGGQCVSYVSFETSGDLVMYACNGTALWRSSTNGGAKLAVLQDDCNVVLYKDVPVSNAAWSTNTAVCLDVHIVAHSHDDVGWLLNPDEYYTGCSATPQPNHGVRSIISNVVDSLLQHPEHQFSQVEMYFFNRWWQEQSAQRRADVRKLVANGQLEFVNGGWSMHDEACVHHLSAVNNMALGAQDILKDVNATVKVGWHIDPFGHASATPRLMAQMGFDAFFFMRQDPNQDVYMQQTKTLENLWRSSPSQGSKVDMFTSIIYDDYCGCDHNYINICPSQFNYDLCGGRPTLNTAEQENDKTDIETLYRMFHVNDTHTPEGRLRQTNMTAVAVQFSQWIKDHASRFRTNIHMVPWGCDFQFTNAYLNYEKMDEIMKIINSDPTTFGMTLKYSTPHKYVQAVNALNYSWPVNNDDYFIAGDNNHTYLAGYFSSRPAFKGYERALMYDLAAMYQIQTLLPFDAASYASVRVMREALGVAQHHDSITGTEREAVRDNYQLLLANGTASAEQAVSAAVQKLLRLPAAPQRCNLANISICAATLALNTSSSTSSLPIYVYNSLAHETTEVVSVPVPGPSYKVTTVGNGSKSDIPSQVVSAWALQLTVDKTSPEASSSEKQPYELHFQLTLPPLSFVTVVIERTSAVASTSSERRVSSGSPVSIENDVYAVYVDGNGLLAAVYNKQTKRNQTVAQNLYHYCPGNSNAYIFRTCKPNEKPVAFASRASVTVVQGALFDEIRQDFGVSDNIHQAIRVNKVGMPFVELLTGVGELDVSGGQGKEVVMRFDTSVSSGAVWYQDSQGLEVQRRVRDSRPNYPYTVTEPVAGNFFPSNVFTYIADDKGQNLGVLADRSRASASMSSGSVEFLVHRRLLVDDGRGVGQALNENTRIITRSVLVVGSDSLNSTLRLGQVYATRRPVLFFGAVQPHSAPMQGTFTTATSATKPLPDQLELMSREYLEDGRVLVRLRHVFAVDEDPHMSTRVCTDVAGVLPAGTSVKSLTETDLNGITTLSSQS
eukprot:PhM_4_TR16801/c0_g1_i9/m.51945/K12311/MAN2B1, LAMAN; lysosomal alpha-mannosidase